jgi:uncharacterized membrane protein YccC
MVQVKFTIEADTVAAFKSRCASEGVSMASVIYQWMKTGKPTKSARIKMDTRPQRRKAVDETIAVLENLLQMEEEYRDAIPETFQSRYETADQACEQLSEAISLLEDAF